MFMKKICDDIVVRPYDEGLVDKYKYLKDKEILVEVDGVKYKKIFGYDKEFGIFGTYWKNIDTGETGNFDLEYNFGVKDSVIEIDFEVFESAVNDIRSAGVEFKKYIKDIGNIRVEFDNIVIETDTSVGCGIYSDVKCCGKNITYVGDVPILDDIEKYISVFSDWIREVYNKVYPKFREIEKKYNVRITYDEEE